MNEGMKGKPEPTILSSVDNLESLVDKLNMLEINVIRIETCLQGLGSEQEKNIIPKLDRSQSIPARIDKIAVETEERINRIGKTVSIISSIIGNEEQNH